MTDTESLDLTLSCAICLDIASFDNAVETSCCHQLFCSPCIETLERCPACRTEKFQTQPAHFARRLIGSLAIPCPNDGCTAKITRSNLSDHLAVSCAFQSLSCPDPQCRDFKCNKRSFLEHLTTKHGKFLMENFHKLWQTQGTSGREVRVAPKEKQAVLVTAPASENSSDNRIEATRNILGRVARLGASGKFYCGGQLDGFRCQCCNGQCGPGNGCNCSGCMLLDVQKRQLPRGWLVNREGAPARLGAEAPALFYCGRRVLTDNPRTDGYCGPTNGDHCSACERLNEQQQRRYGSVWRN